MEVSGNTAHKHSVVMCVQTGARGRKLDSKQQNTLIRLVIILCVSRLCLSSWYFKTNTCFPCSPTGIDDVYRRGGWVTFMLVLFTEHHTAALPNGRRLFWIMNCLPLLRKWRFHPKTSLALKTGSWPYKTRGIGYLTSTKTAEWICSGHPILG